MSALFGMGGRSGARLYSRLQEGSGAFGARVQGLAGAAPLKASGSAHRAGWFRGECCMPPAAAALAMQWKTIQPGCARKWPISKMLFITYEINVKHRADFPLRGGKGTGVSDSRGCRGALRPENPVTCFPLGEVVRSTKRRVFHRAAGAVVWLCREAAIPQPSAGGPSTFPFEPFEPSEPYEPYEPSRRRRVHEPSEPGPLRGPFPFFPLPRCGTIVWYSIQKIKCITGLILFHSYQGDGHHRI